MAPLLMNASLSHHMHPHHEMVFIEFYTMNMLCFIRICALEPIIDIPKSLIPFKTKLGEKWTFVSCIHIWEQYPTSNLYVLCGAYLQSIQNMAQEYGFYNNLLGVGCWYYSYVSLYVLDHHGTIDIGTIMLLAKLSQSGCCFKHGSNTLTSNTPAFYPDCRILFIELSYIHVTSCFCPLIDDYLLCLFLASLIHPVNHRWPLA